MKFTFLAIAYLIVVLPHLAIAQNDFLIPPPLFSGRSDFLSRGLKESCYSMQISDISMGRPCNPAFLSLNQEEKIFVHGFVGNNVNYFRDVISILNYDASTSTVRRLFNQSRDSEFEGDVEIYYRKDDWTLSFSPSRVSYYALIRNHVLPFVSLYASQEHILRAQKSWTVGTDLYFGLQTRAVVRRFILSEFVLTDAIVENSEDFLRTRYQNALYLEPGILWAPTNRRLDPQITATVTKLGITSRHYKELPYEVEGEVGMTVSPDVGFGHLRVGPHVSFNSRTEHWEDHIRMSAVLETQPIQYVGSLKMNQFDLGAFYQLQKWNAGLLYDFQYIENLKGQDEYLTTWYFQLGYEIE